jgi:hypothetical protein
VNSTNSLDLSNIVWYRTLRAPQNQIFRKTSRSRSRSIYLDESVKLATAPLPALFTSTMPASNRGRGHLKRRIHTSLNQTTITCAMFTHVHVILFQAQTNVLSVLELFLLSKKCCCVPSTGRLRLLTLTLTLVTFYFNNHKAAA